MVALFGPETDCHDIQYCHKPPVQLRYHFSFCRFFSFFSFFAFVVRFSFLALRFSNDCLMIFLYFSFRLENPSENQAPARGQKSAKKVAHSVYRIVD